MADRYIVEPGEATGVSIRIPVAYLEVAVALLAPYVSEAALEAQHSEVALYPTVGLDTLNGRSVRHRWVNILGSPPEPDHEAGFAVGAMGFIGSRGSPISRMWIRAGQPHVPGRIRRFHVDRAARRVDIVVETAGGSVGVSGSFVADGDPWESHPTHYHIVTAPTPLLYFGDESATRHDGSGTVTWRPASGRSLTFEAYVGVDVDLGWDYTFDPVRSPARAGRASSPWARPRPGSA